MAQACEYVFLVPGELVPGLARGNGPVGQPVPLKVRPGQDVVRLTIANGPVLVLHPESASALFAAHDAPGPDDGPACVHVREQLAWTSLEGARNAPTGWLGHASLAAFEVLADVVPELGAGMAAEEAARLLARKVDAQVEPGLYALQADRFEQAFKALGQAPLAQVPAATDGGALLVLVHGTFVDSHSTFGKLWHAQPDKVRQLFEAYGGRVYAFDHRTLEDSPVRNALALVAALPAGARLHLLTHSRGGLVAEVLARACSGAAPPHVTLDAGDATDLEQLFRAAQAKSLRVERMVRVACPARGTLLASRRLDTYLSVLAWALQLAGQPVLGALMDFLHGIAKKRADPCVLPGLAAMMPDSPLLRWFASAQEAMPGDLRVIAGDAQGDSLASWIKTLVADAYYWTDNDFIVHTRAMYGGVPRADGSARFLLDRGGRVSHFSYFSNDRTATAIVDALLQDAPADFAAIGPQSWAGEDAGGARAAPPAARNAKTAAPQPLLVRVLNEDLQFIPDALLVGHYRSLTLTGSERVVDRLVRSAMRASLAAGLYPDAPGTYQVFPNERPHPDNPLEMARPRAAVVVGLGEEGKLTASQLCFSVQQAVLAYAQRIAEEPGDPPPSFELCATLVGSGGPRISAGMAAQAVAQGTFQARQKASAAGWPVVARLTLVELFLERAAEAWHALRQQEAAWAQRIQVEGWVERAPGGMRRSVDASYRGASYDFISALSTRDGKGNVCIAYELDTRRARTEVRAMHAQAALVRELVATASARANDDPLIGRTLFDLLVPLEIEPYLAGAGEMVLEVDAGTAVIPWELLKASPDGSGGDERPWSVRSRVLRKLRTDRFRESVRDASAQDAVLVIGDPLAPPEYPALEGALAEAQAVAAQLGTQLPAAQVTALPPQSDARAVINALLARAWRIVHVAGHGAPGAEGGVVLSGNAFLGAQEVAAMRTVPELVFLNCCHLARGDVRALGRVPDRAEFAATIAEELIAIGVRCVIAAGWAVEDGPAQVFATRFYASLLAGARFIDAVGAAREAAWQCNPQGNTWAAYQCYGDPGWRWDPAGADERAPARAGTDDMANVASSVGLVLALENLATECRFGTRGARDALERIRFLEGRFAVAWGAQGDVAEAFGLAYAEVEALGPALSWLQRAVAAENGGATLRAAEQLADVRTRMGEAAGDAEPVRAGIAELERLAAIAATNGRLMLLGGAYKRLALLAWKQQHAQDAVRCARQSAVWYEQAQRNAAAADPVAAFDPARGALGARLAATMMEGRRPKAEAAQLAILQHMTRSATSARPEVHTVAGVASAQVLQGLVQGKLRSSVADIVAGLRDLHGRVPAPQLWDSVHGEASFLLTLYRDLPRGAPGEAQAVDALLGVLAGFAQAPA